MALPSVKLERPFTYGDYLTWPDEERWEIIDGVPVNMGPAPMRRHQKILGELYGHFYTNSSHSSHFSARDLRDIRVLARDRENEHRLILIWIHSVF